MEPTAGQILEEIQRTHDSLVAVRGELLTATAVSTAVRDGIRAAVSDPEVWSSAISAIQVHARAEAGGWLFGGLRAMASKAFWVLLIGSGVYALGGWSALVALVKSRA